VPNSVQELSLNLDARTYIQKANVIKVFRKYSSIARSPQNESRGVLEKRHLTQCLTFLEQRVQNECLDLFNSCGKPLSALMS